jgi:disabled family protein 2
MSDASVSSPETPTTSNKSNAKKFEGDGVSFKGKLIGMEDLSIDRDEKICLDSMFKLKAVVRARGEHKQKIQLNLTMSAVRIIDDTTKVFIIVFVFIIISN